MDKKICTYVDEKLYSALERYKEKYRKKTSEVLRELLIDELNREGLLEL